MINTTRPTPPKQRKSESYTMMGMADADVVRIATEAVTAGKPILQTLAAEHYRREGLTPPNTTCVRPAATARPAAQRPAVAVPARPTPARPAAPTNALADVAEHLLRQRASHRSAPPDQAKAAIIELARRGVIYSNGIFSQSHRSA